MTNSIQAVETGLRTTPVIITGRPVETHELLDRMHHYQVPGLSLAVIDQGEIVWAKGYGVTDVRTSEAMTSETLLYAASISKSVSALVALHFVEKGLLGLDQNVNDKLITWQVPENEFTQTEKVTLRRILSHTSGLDAGTYSGYSENGPMPTLLQLLRGDSPSNSSPVKVIFVPGSRYDYSGPGFWVMQQLLEDISGQSFADLAQETVLEKVGMMSSLFQPPRPRSLKTQVAVEHNASGEAIFDKSANHPAQTDGTLLTTPTDLAHFAIEIYRASQGLSNQIISTDLAREMLTEQIMYSGLGVDLLGEARTFRFGKGGEGEGAVCEMKLFTETGQGAVIMTNGRNGYDLIQELYRSIAATYDWPDYRQTSKPMAKVEQTQIQAYEGVYQVDADPALRGQFINYTGMWQVGDGRDILYQVQPSVDEQGQPCLQVEYPVPHVLTYYPKTAQTFFTMEEETEITFIKNDDDTIDDIQIVLSDDFIVTAHRRLDHNTQQ
ncbi:MAG: serine hydrolase domain-containing protein [Chloroflexota bacterium]